MAGLFVFAAIQFDAPPRVSIRRERGALFVTAQYPSPSQRLCSVYRVLLLLLRCKNSNPCSDRLSLRHLPVDWPRPCACMRLRVKGGCPGRDSVCHILGYSRARHLVRSSQSPRGRISTQRLDVNQRNPLHQLKKCSKPRRDRARIWCRGCVRTSKQVWGSFQRVGRD